MRKFVIPFLPEIKVAFKKDYFPNPMKGEKDYIDLRTQYEKEGSIEEEITEYCLKKATFENFIWNRYKDEKREVSYTMLDTLANINSLNICVWYMEDSNKDKLGLMHFYPQPFSNDKEAIHLLKVKGNYKGLKIL